MRWFLNAKIIYLENPLKSFCISEFLVYSLYKNFRWKLYNTDTKYMIPIYLNFRFQKFSLEHYVTTSPCEEIPHVSQESSSLKTERCSNIIG